MGKTINLISLKGGKLPHCKGYHIQGCCSDNNYIYVAYAPTNKKARAGVKKGFITRYKLTRKDKNIKISNSKIVQGIDMGHANGMCYDSKYKRLIITYSNGANVNKKTGNYRYVKALYVKEFKNKKQKVKHLKKISLKGISGNSNASKSYTSIIYIPKTNKFILHSRFGRSLMIKAKNSKNDSFKVTRQEKTKKWPSKINGGSAKGQAAYFDEDNEYFIQLVYGHGNHGNNIYKYKASNFEFIEACKLNVKSEQEAIFKHQGHVYIVSGGGYIKEIKI